MVHLINSLNSATTHIPPPPPPPPHTHTHTHTQSSLHINKKACMHMACGPNFQPIEMVRGLGEVIGKNLNILVGALGYSLQKGAGAHT